MDKTSFIAVIEISCVIQHRSNYKYNLINEERQMYKLVVWVMIKKDEEILLLKKPDNSEWTLAGGHVEDNESLKDAAIRTVKAETSIELDYASLDLLCIIDREMDSGYKLHAFFKATQWHGELNNNEPDVHSEIKWHKLNSLPENLGALASSAVKSVNTGDFYYFENSPNKHNKH
ncbi:MAG: NUDIX domain-containing protein [Rickettsiaceae bacterium]|nr:MAG: NUDIX domain-containing protein [Rickettsiaceae bacterium]